MPKKSLIQKPEGGFPKTPAGDRAPSVQFKEDLEAGVFYELTEDVALVYAKLLSVGCPPIRAVLYITPSLNETEKGRETAKKVAFQWQHSKLTMDCLDSINGGKWHELPAERRYQLALDKSNAECAFYLWTTNYNSIEHREGIEKIKLARDIMKGILGQAPDVDDPMAAFARLAIELTRNADANRAASGKKAPVTVPSDMEKLISVMPKGPM